MTTHTFNTGITPPPITNHLISHKRPKHDSSYPSLSHAKDKNP